MLRVYQVLSRALVYNLSPIMMQVLTFIEDVINIFYMVVANFAFWIVPDFILKTVWLVGSLLW